MHARIWGSIHCSLPFRRIIMAKKLDDPRLPYLYYTGLFFSGLTLVMFLYGAYCFIPVSATYGPYTESEQTKMLIGLCFSASGVFSEPFTAALILISMNPDFFFSNNPAVEKKKRYNPLKLFICNLLFIGLSLYFLGAVSPEGLPACLLAVVMATAVNVICFVLIKAYKKVYCA
jgi:hypothetical protein